MIFNGLYILRNVMIAILIIRVTNGHSLPLVFYGFMYAFTGFLAAVDFFMLAYLIYITIIFVRLIGIQNKKQGLGVGLAITVLILTIGFYIVRTPWYVINFSQEIQ